MNRHYQTSPKSDPETESQRNCKNKSNLEKNLKYLTNSDVENWNQQRNKQWKEIGDSRKASRGCWWIYGDDGGGWGCDVVVDNWLRKSKSLFSLCNQKEN